MQVKTMFFPHGFEKPWFVFHPLTGLLDYSEDDVVLTLLTLILKEIIFRMVRRRNTKEE
jgi:hypothetical protein